MSEVGTGENFIGGETELVALAREAGVAPALGADGAESARAILVFDESATQIRHASAAARALSQGIAEANGALAPRIAEQISRARPVSGRPVMARVQFDGRRIAPLSTCLIARAALPGGESVVILSLVDRPPRLRPLSRAAQPASDASATIPVAPAADAPAPVDGSPRRFTWRSDDGDVITQISGLIGESARAALIDRSWGALAEARILGDAEDVLAALSARRTFRAITVTLRTAAPAEAVELDLSGAPLGRGGHGFAGFGLVRPARDRPPEEGPAPASQPSAPEAPLDLARDEAAVAQKPEQSQAPELPHASEPTQAPELDPEPASLRNPEPPASLVAHRPVERPFLAVEPASAQPSPKPSPLSKPSPSPLSKPSPESPVAEAGLSSNEHDAFREIARALGARFAGDDAPEPGASPTASAAPGGSVTPFPARPAEPAEADPSVAATLEHLPSGALVYRGDALLFANRRLLEFAGYASLAALEAAGGLGRLFHGLSPHERAESDAPAALAASDGRSLPVDLQHSAMEWRGARAELVLVRAAPVGDPAGELAALRVSQDFAARRAADAVAIVEALSDGVATLDANGRVLSLNRSAAALFRLDPREIVGGGFASLFAPESAVEVLAAIHGAPGADGETVARARDGLAPLGLTLSRLRPGGDGSLAVLIRDMTKARAAAKAPGADAEAVSARRVAEAASAQKSNFLATISHEIRTPMNSILGFADVMLAEQFGPIGSERYREYLGDIHASGSHVLSLVNDLLDLAKIEAGRLELAFTDVPLNALVSSCVALMQPQAARGRIVVRTSFSADLTTVVADERSVRQAALNVIANAIQFTEAGGQVIVSTTIAERGEIALRVRDTGIGMSPDEVETALEPFRQVSVAGARKGGGTGLGLPLTKALIEANHGRFRITSQKDEGTLVELLFPAPDAMSA